MSTPETDYAKRKKGFCFMFYVHVTTKLYFVALMPWNMSNFMLNLTCIEGQSWHEDDDWEPGKLTIKKRREKRGERLIKWQHVLFPSLSASYKLWVNSLDGNYICLWDRQRRKFTRIIICFFFWIIVTLNKSRSMSSVVIWPSIFTKM